ncbi:NADPH:quinone reductase-like Zn-dependent oxidoreductase [Novosphingobium sp. PhB57]|uniref:zinc-binding dehydrogenase n=1 Tax=Novosphingobium sp. PhB57 TaxID=2485107 RepID=UPI0010501DA5|nr:zinc-binding dehydrogenase [Novosphingobium sp. PhB57]TCU58582.1 NADPH:quinone reductase-like Zn-dependent oxidoreductase [Novosphingobium sp. PhB57]
MDLTGRELRSTIEDGRLTLSLEDVRIDEPADDEIVVRVEATPINPSDLGLLLGPADVSTMEKLEGDRPRLRFAIPESRMSAVSGRLGQSMSVGNEGAGIVVAAGGSAAALKGKRVGMIGGGMFADYRRIKASDVIPLPDGATSAQGASMFVNPLTALGFVETARREGHKAIVHTAAASNLGQMLQKICLHDGIPLVNIVRSEQQADILRKIGAEHIVNSQDEDFGARLAEAVEQTGATVAFDAIGGGTLPGTILQAMERASLKRMTEYSRYGSMEFKQLYIYGALDPSPTVLNRLAFGFQWGVSGWLLFPFLQKAGPEVAMKLRSRVVAELDTTFASHYSRVIGLAQALDPDVLRVYERKATGEKFLIDPSLG